MACNGNSKKSIKLQKFQKIIKNPPLACIQFFSIQTSSCGIKKKFRRKFLMGNWAGIHFSTSKKKREKSVCSQWCGKQSIKSHLIWVIFVGSFSLHQMRIIYSIHEWVFSFFCAAWKWVEAASTWENLLALSTVVHSKL